MCILFVTGQFGKDPLNNCSESQSYSLSCKLSLDFDVLDVQPQIRSCSATYDIIDSCPDGVYDFCQLYYLTVNYQGKTYSNPHCAQCHGIPLNTTQCSSLIRGSNFCIYAIINFSKNTCQSRKY